MGTVGRSVGRPAAKKTLSLIDVTKKWDALAGDIEWSLVHFLLDLARAGERKEGAREEEREREREGL